MQPQLLSVSGIVLARREGAGKFDRLDVLTAEHGVLPCMQQHGKAGGQIAADIFDFAELGLERRGTRSNWFVKDLDLVKRHGGIGKNYRALQQASSWGRFAIRNSIHLEGFSGIYSITCEALSAWDAGSPPAVVYLKALYLFGREEGLPVKEHWQYSLNAEEREIADHLLRTPSLKLGDWEKQGQALLDSLKGWLESEHDMRFKE